MTNHTVQLFRVGDEQETELIIETSVPSGTTVMQIIDEHNITLRRFCNQGSCGTCECTVLAGVENLQDKRNGRMPMNPKQVRSCVMEIRGDVEILITQKPSLLESAKAATQKI